MSVTYSAGLMTAYGAAKDAGYTGTYAQFCQAMRDLAGIVASATTLPAGSQATATYNNGTLSFGIPKGDKGDKGDTGETGNGIVSVTKTGTSGLVDTYTITFTNGTTTTFEITNGEDGEVTQAQLDEVANDVSDLKNAFAQKTITGNPIVFSDGSGLDAIEVIATLEYNANGVTSNTLTYTGKNLCPSTGWVSGQYIDGSWGGWPARLTSPFIPILPNVQYTFSIDQNATADLAWINFNYFDADKTWLGSRTDNGDASFNGSRTHATTITDSDARYIRLTARSYANADTDIRGYDIADGTPQLEVGDTVTDYEAYTVNTYTVDLSSITSLYGGTMNYTTGVLTSVYDSDGTELATPVTYTLTAQDIATIIGNNTITSSDSGDLSVEYYRGMEAIAENADSSVSALTWDCSDYIRGKFVTGMTHSGSGTYVTSSTRNAIVKPLMFDFDITVNVAIGYRYGIQYYDGYVVGSSHMTSYTSFSTGGTTIPAGSYFCMIVASTSDATVDSTTQNNLTFTAMVSADDIYGRLFDDSAYFTDYVIDTAFVKTPVQLVMQGILSGAQSFCIYNDSYYSTDGSYLYAQDSSFDVTSTTTLSLGHGNSMQLGSNGMAYVSGWNDDTIYVVDLANNAIDSTIALPVSGYTTCAVDDINQLVYIFHRTSYPSTEENYNFIVYDYANATTVSTKLTTVAFAAMQAVDFIEGKIFVLNGTGTSAKPNGYRIYNTSGDVLAEYVFESQSTVEPEGVFVDRDTKDVYISYVDGRVYKVEKV